MDIFTSCLFHGRSPSVWASVSAQWVSGLTEVWPQKTAWLHFLYAHDRCPAASSSISVCICIAMRWEPLSFSEAETQHFPSHSHCFISHQMCSSGIKSCHRPNIFPTVLYIFFWNNRSAFEFPLATNSKPIRFLSCRKRSSTDVYCDFISHALKRKKDLFFSRRQSSWLIWTSTVCSFYIFNISLFTAGIYWLYSITCRLDDGELICKVL